MKTILVIFFLTVQSSYVDNTEVAATPQAYDTVQFYAGGDASWRIKTYAANQDVHIWSIGPYKADILDLARTNTHKHYGDVLGKEIVLESEDGVDGLRRELRARGLDDHLELPPSGAVFWAPRGSTYRSKSRPEKAN